MPISCGIVYCRFLKYISDLFYNEPTTACFVDNYMSFHFNIHDDFMNPELTDHVMINFNDPNGVSLIIKTNKDHKIITNKFIPHKCICEPQETIFYSYRKNPELANIVMSIKYLLCL